MTSHERETFERHFAMSERDFGRMSESFSAHERLVIALAKYGLGARERRTATSGQDARQPEKQTTAILLFGNYASAN